MPVQTFTLLPSRPGTMDTEADFQRTSPDVSLECTAEMEAFKHADLDERERLRKGLDDVHW